MKKTREKRIWTEDLIEVEQWQFGLDTAPMTSATSLRTLQPSHLKRVEEPYTGQEVFIQSACAIKMSTKPQKGSGKSDFKRVQNHDLYQPK